MIYIPQHIDHMRNWKNIILNHIWHVTIPWRTYFDVTILVNADAFLKAYKLLRTAVHCNSNNTRKVYFYFIISLCKLTISLLLLFHYYTNYIILCNCSLHSYCQSYCLLSNIRWAHHAPFIPIIYPISNVFFLLFKYILLLLYNKAL